MLSICMTVHLVHVLCFNYTPTHDTSTLSLHDALPIYDDRAGASHPGATRAGTARRCAGDDRQFCRAVPDRKSTRLNFSHVETSYAVFCLKKKNIPDHAVRYGLVRLVIHLRATDFEHII